MGWLLNCLDSALSKKPGSQIFQTYVPIREARTRNQGFVFPVFPLCARCVLCGEMLLSRLLWQNDDHDSTSSDHSRLPLSDCSPGPGSEADEILFRSEAQDILRLSRERHADEAG